MGRERRQYSKPYLKGCARDGFARILAGPWLWLSWPWWAAAGLIVVPFLSELWLAEWLLSLGIFSSTWILFRNVRLVSSAVILLILGAIWGTLRGQVALDRALPDVLIKQDVWASGTVRGLPRPQGRALRFKFNIESLEYRSRAFAFSGDVLLNGYKPFPDLKAGQRWRFKLRLKPASGSLNPGGFNYAQWLFSQGIRATGYVREPKNAILLEEPGPVPRMDRVRAEVRQFIASQGMTYGGLLNALAVGVRTGISKQQWQLVRDTGTAHLIAISGLHIGMVAAIAYFLGQLFWRHSLLVYTLYPAQKVARIAAILAAVVYAALAGFSLPTLRALLMLLTYFSLQSLRRNPGTLFSLGFVLLVVLLFNPLAPLGSGFWLSFSAVGAIALAVRNQHFAAYEAGPGTVTLSYQDKAKRWFGQWWRVQWAVFIGLFPFTLFFFQQVSMVSLLANFIAIPLIASLVVPLVLLALVCFFLGLSGLSVMLLSLADTLLAWLWPWLESLSGLFFSVWVSAAPALWVMSISVAGTIMLFRAELGRARYLGSLGFLPLFLVPAPVWERGAFRLHVLDVGQGLAVVVETQGHSLLYDAGIRFSTGFDVGSAIVVPFLRQQRIGPVNTLVASHDNLDHVGGMDSVINAHPDAKRYSSAGFYAGSEPCTAGLSWQWDGVRFSFLHPEPGNTGVDNNDSCVLKIESRYGSALLTGDIEREAERGLVQDAGDALRKIDVLLVPHHGSKTSSTKEFVQLIAPGLALISAGYLNRFGHPHPQVAERYAALDIRLLNTADSGWIKVEFDQRGVQATPWRAVYKRYWLTRRATF